MNPRHALGDLIALSQRQRHAAKELAWLVRMGHGNSPQAQKLANQLFDPSHKPTVKPPTETPRPKAGKKRKQRKGRAA